MTSPAPAGPASPSAPASVGGPAERYGMRHAARMEWIKLRSLRSTPWALLLSAAAMVAMGVVTMANTRAPSPDKAAAFDPTNNVLAGVAVGQLVIGVLGVLFVTGEYASGSISSTLAAVPRRRLVLAAKAGVFGALALAVGEAAVLLAFLAGRAALHKDVAHPSFDQPGVLRAVLLAGAYLALIGLMGVGLGALTRHTASAIGVLVGIVFVLPVLLAGLTGVRIAKYFPTMIAGNSLAVAKPVADMLSPWTGFAVLCLYAVLALCAGGAVLVRRDVRVGAGTGH
ncbi:ABC transporter permease [Streptomyces sulfonofaciens]|uniref:ABC transporter permease n=1 Tax=Streptomyces sulfonofaciens TaxID=68272 RepID=A0A919FW83_9ACTN|nr:ABC transporter permease [Streptomyces sulfonofaciens]GHH72916.1 ABC transporter permease [Streptomyces sulfonofaciens]